MLTIIRDQYVNAFTDSVTEIRPDITRFHRNCALFFFPNCSRKGNLFFLKERAFSHFQLLLQTVVNLRNSVLWLKNVKFIFMKEYI